jgi:hypothetical protein
MNKQALVQRVYWHKSNREKLNVMRNCPKCPVQTVTDPTEVVYEDYYHPQVVQLVHHVEVVRRHVFRSRSISTLIPSGMKCAVFPELARQKKIELPPRLYFTVNSRRQTCQPRL